MQKDVVSQVTGGPYYKGAGVQSIERHGKSRHVGNACYGYRQTTSLQCRCPKHRNMGVMGCGYGYLGLLCCLPVTWLWCITQCCICIKWWIAR